ncbi:MAG: DEAD/DEAH box helicase family protein [Calditrichia bacterium]
MNYFQDATFKFSWRPYQKRVLEELELHLSDDRLHVVAPPGSGKTVLGLEIMRHLGKPTLALAPTLTIRNQWVERFTELFLQLQTPPNWISTSLDAPAFFTVSTYQSLHAILGHRKNSVKKAERAEAVLQALSGQNIHTLIVDEAHHLQKEWWKSMDRLRKHIGEHTVVALTATPPYDVSGSEWERYIELCGPIDAEISIPEMMLEYSLCPHQDFIFLSPPTASGQQAIDSFRSSVDSFVEDIKNHGAFTLLMQETPFLKKLTDTSEDAEKLRNEAFREITKHSEFFFALLVFLNEVLVEPQLYLCRLLDVEATDIPPLDKFWLERLLNECIYERFDEYTEEEQEILVAIRRLLRKIGAIENKQIKLSSTENLDKVLLRDPNKLQSVLQIVEKEAAATRPQDLRLVILCDLIRLDLFPQPGETSNFQKLGVVPIFESLRTDCRAEIRLGILCGSLVVLPANALSELEVVAGSRYGITLADMRMKQLPHDRGFFTLECNDQNRQHIVAIVTELFTMGAVTVLVGTRALLGEGWDAPVVSTLILANNVGSHVSSNQMRGRALRTVANDGDKSSNIWHLASISTSGDPGPDIRRIDSRFKTFMGLSFNDTTIENGLERMNLAKTALSKEEIRSHNQIMTKAATERSLHAKRWEEALQVGKTITRHTTTPPRKRDEVAIPGKRIPTFATQKLVVKAVSQFSRTALTTLVALPFAWSLFPAAFPWIAGLGITTSVWHMFNPGMKYKMNFQREKISWDTTRKDLEQIADALIKTLKDCNILSRDYNYETLPIYQSNGLIYISLKGGTNYEETIFLEAFSELFDPIRDPRYLLVRRLVSGGITREFYHTVPTLLARNKQQASKFEKRWKEYVGEASVHYTKTIAGMQILLRARAQSLKQNKLGASKRISRWK